MKSKVLRYVHHVEYLLVQLTTPEDKERFQFGAPGPHGEPSAGLPVGVFPLPRLQHSYRDSTASVKYFPARLTKGRTVHKAQGAKIPTLLVGGNSNFYTAISRGVQLESVYLLADVSNDALTSCKPTQAKQAMLDRHAQIAAATKAALTPPG